MNGNAVTSYLNSEPVPGLRRVEGLDVPHDANRGYLVLVRHAQSQWNLEGRFTGWADVPLTAAGREEATAAGHRLAVAGLRFDRGYVSRLIRARETLRIMLEGLGQSTLPVEESWRLNERHYGALQGLDKGETIAIHGEAQVLRWRRGYLDQPPALDRVDPRHPRFDSRYRDIKTSYLPAAESLADTRDRLLPYWNRALLPMLLSGRRLLVSSHGNTLRALIMHIEGLSVEAVEALEIPTATPVLYTVDLEEMRGAA